MDMVRPLMGGPGAAVECVGGVHFIVGSEDRTPFRVSDCDGHLERSYPSGVWLPMRNTVAQAQ